MSESPTEVASTNEVPPGASEVTLDDQVKTDDAVGEGGDQAKSASSGELAENRESWGSKVAYFLTLVGYAVGFGNIWRFPYLLHSNGGAAFLIPYCIMLAFEGIPLFFLELAVGQRLRKGALGSWNEISPYLGGLGIACGLTCYFVVFYYNTLIAWVLSYLFDSFRSTLPWESCKVTMENIRSYEATTINEQNETVPLECDVSQQASKYYWYRRTVDVSESITDPGNFNPWIFLYLIISWICTWAILIKGIQSSEKVVYFTALFPYITLLCFFVGNFWMDGFENGYNILFKPDFSVLIKPQVWLKAGTQIFFSLGVAYGCLIVFASYLPSNNDCYKDAVYVSLINCSTSLLAAIVLFPVLGAQGTRKFKECRKIRQQTLASILGDPSNYEKYIFSSKEDDAKKITGMVEHYYISPNKTKIPLTSPFEFVPERECDLEKSIRDSGAGTGLVFIAFAEAAVNLPCPQFWCFLFFFMLFTLGIDSSFGTCEGAIAALVDMKVLKWPRWAITSVVCGSLLVLSMIFTLGWGIYVQVFIDQFVANWSLLIVAFFETVGIAWIYGLAKFSYDIKLMTGKKPNIFMLICWKFISPVLLIVILIMSIVEQFVSGYNYQVYDIKEGITKDVPYPAGIIALGYILWLGIICWVPVQAIMKLFKRSLLKEEKPAFFPEAELRAERNMEAEDDFEQFDNLDKLVMGKSVEDFIEYRKSTTSIHGHTDSKHDVQKKDTSAVDIPENTQGDGTA